MSVSRTRVKVCGITRVEDAMAAVECGADAIGLVFYKPSPRCVSLEQAKKISQSLPPFITVVALTVDANEQELGEIIKHVPVDLMQFHGNETETQCLSAGLPYIKAVRMQNGNEFSDAELNYPSARGVLVDTYKKGVPGGTGESFDWGLLPGQRSKPLVLAGGLNAENVRNAISTVQPFAVDVSGGVEIGKGIKSPELIESFIKEVSGGS